ncbi:hypothetical protein MSA03_15510 [Microbacterium saccharophilum]|nr:glycoside hydrolase family 32 protein [Microbacterium saccharophilum]GEP48043.1 hypothetical protein MSA03_15510 [Microbacterium saccharophilum]
MRPTIHFTPASGWINDPHGITATDDGYQVFFQYVPGRTEWAPDCHWGHATGRDLLSLREKQVAIAPGDGDDGIWTGCIVGTGRSARAFYTAISTPDFGIGRVRVAHPVDDQWTVWAKDDVVVHAPEGMDLIAFRDPFIRREADGWRMFVGGADRDGTARALTYTSRNLEEWSYDGVALERSTALHDPVWMGALWECPQVFELGDRSMLISSIWDADVLHYAAYAVGTFLEGRFEAADWTKLTWGPSLYAPSLFTDAEGELALTFWLRGIRGENWVGAHSIPYRIAEVDGRLVATPHPDVAAHRSAPAPDGVVDGLAADIEWSQPGGSLAISSGGEDAVRVEVDGGEAVVATSTDEYRIPVDGVIRMIIDGPVLELSSSAGLFAAAVEPKGSDLSVAVSAGTVMVCALS